MSSAISDNDDGRNKHSDNGKRADPEKADPRHLDPLPSDRPLARRDSSVTTTCYAASQQDSCIVEAEGNVFAGASEAGVRSVPSARVAAAAHDLAALAQGMPPPVVPRADEANAICESSVARKSRCSTPRRCAECKTTITPMWRLQAGERCDHTTHLPPSTYPFSSLSSPLIADAPPVLCPSPVPLPPSLPPLSLSPPHPPQKRGLRSGASPFCVHILRNRH